MFVRFDIFTKKRWFIIFLCVSLQNGGSNQKFLGGFGGKSENTHCFSIIRPLLVRYGDNIIKIKSIRYINQSDACFECKYSELHVSENWGSCHCYCCSQHLCVPHERRLTYAEGFFTANMLPLLRGFTVP